MKTKIGIVLTAIAAIVASVVVAIQPAHAAVGIRITNGRLVEGNGQQLILRGVNHAHTWYKMATDSYPAIKAAGANAVRVVVSGGRWQPAETTQDITNIINLCKANRLICVLENHDTTGFNEQGGAVSLDQAVSYWISVRNALVGQENYVILNIGNEPFGNGSNPASSTWPTATSAAIQRLRSNGFEHTIMVDAPNWGQDWGFVMRDNAQTVFNADPARNTIFSVHMYGVYDTAAEITAYLDSFVTRGLPLVVGEFGHNHSDGDPDENTIFSATQARGIGYMGWSWSGNSGGVEYLDMVQNNGNGTFNHNVRTSWGTRIISGANGLLATSREATIYSGQTGNPTTSRPPTTTSRPPTTTSRPPTTTTRPPTTTSRPPTTTTRPPTTSPPPPGGCSATYTRVNQWDTGFQGEVRVANTGSTTTSWTVVMTFANGQRVTQIWGGRTTVPASSPVTVTNETWNGSIGTGQAVTFGFLGSWTGTNNNPTLTCSRTP
jgi:mannan endo-1,4-beta-mannosidase